MATLQFMGDAVAVAQVDTVQITADDASTTYTITINGKAVSVAGAGTGVNDTASALKTALDASTIPEFAEITVTVSTDTVTMTGPSTGKPFTATSSKSGGTGTIGSVTSVTTPDGPSNWTASNFANVSTGARALPGSGDTVFFQDSAVSCLYGLNQASAGELTALHVTAGYTGEIGLPRVNSDGDSDYIEYRQRYLRINVTTVVIGEGDGDGSARIQLDCDDTTASATSIEVWKTASSDEDDYHALQIKGDSGCAVTLKAHSGTIDVCPEGGATIAIADVTAIGDSTVRVKGGDAVATFTVGGTAEVDCQENITTLVLRDTPTFTLRETATVGTATVYGGTLNYNSSGTCTTMNIGSGGTVSTAGNLAGVTFTNTTLDAGGTLSDPAGKITFTNDIDLGLAALADVTLDVGRGRNIGVS